jgi:hypothetical protein
MTVPLCVAVLPLVDAEDENKDREGAEDENTFCVIVLARCCSVPRGLCTTAAVAAPTHSPYHGCVAGAAQLDGA